MSYNPFDLSGGAFLTLYIALFAVALTASILIPNRMRPTGRRQRVTDTDMLAYLAGGELRLADAMIARLLANGALTMVGRDGFGPVPGRQGATVAENRVLALPAPFDWRAVQKSVHGLVDPLVGRMRMAGLLMTAEERKAIRFRAALPFMLLFAFGAVKWMVGMARDRPIGFLTVLLIVTAIAAFLRLALADERTQAGRDALAEASDAADRLRRAPTSEETGLAVALFGTAVLAGSGLAAFHIFRNQGSGDGGSSNSSSDSGDSGCGGGGCGGCGGD